MKKNIVLSLLFASSSLLSCQKDPLLEPNLPEYFLINGDTIKIRDDKHLIYKNSNYFIVGDSIVPSVDWSLKKEPLNNKNIEILKKGIQDPELVNQPLRLIAIGGGPVSGIRNGGYNNENLRSSFPNLVANQLGIDFKLPFFEKEDGNGFGTLVPADFNPTGGSLQKFKAIQNNLGIESIGKSGKPELKPITSNTKIDHYGVSIFPGFATYTDYMNPSSFNYDPTFKRLYDFSKTKNNNYKDIILNEKFDIILDASLMSQSKLNGLSDGGDMIIENGLDGYTDERINCKGIGCQPKFSDRLNFLKELSKRKGLKGVLYTLPPIHIMPFTTVFKVQDVKKQLNIYQKDYLLPENAMFVYPTPSVDSLMGARVNMNMKPFINQNLKEFHKYQTLPYYPKTDLENNLESSRKETYSLSKQLNWAVVDITNIYRDIINNKYISPDGLNINSKQFFAEDGYSPSLLGQVVLANETIKAINKQYGTEIPYVKFERNSKY